MAVLLSIGLAIIYGLKVNLSVAIVSMVNYTAIGLDTENSHAPSEELCEKPANVTIAHTVSLKNMFIKLNFVLTYRTGYISALLFLRIIIVPLFQSPKLIVSLKYRPFYKTISRQTPIPVNIQM